MLKTAIFAVVSSVLLVGAAARSDDRVGRRIDNFSLRDYRGKACSLDECQNNKLVVVAFLGVECPLAKLYAPRLQELAKEYGARGVSFIGVDSNQQDTLTELGAFARKNQIEFPLLKDPGNTVADQFGALRTPEVFVLDAERVVRYCGRIDDQYGLGTSSGYARPKVNRRDLAVALDELLAGKSVSQTAVEAPGCFIGRVSKIEPTGDVTYSNQIARILKDRCVSCHRPGEVAPFPLTSFDEVVGWAETIREVVDQGRMPPWFANPEYGHFVNDARLSDEEKKLIHAWLDNGCAQGDPANLPEPRQFVEGWQIPEPDQVVYISDEPYKVPAEGVVEYQYFAVDPGWTEDKWIKAVEARPGNRSVVHHIIVFVQPPEGREGFDRDAIGGYAPGDGADISPEGVATFVPAGSKIMFQMHYTPNGTEQTDRSYVGIKFADPKSVHKISRGDAAINVLFRIPPGAANHEVKSRIRFKEDSLLYTMMPHMHLRGKSFRFEAEYPDGTREILLDVPKYDFNWQLSYRLAEPKLMPKGTKLNCTAHFDNSAENLANPAPDEWVAWGDQTWEEMMIGFIFCVRANEDIQAQPLQAAAGGE